MVLVRCCVLPGLSHAQLQQLRAMAQDKGHGKPGRSRSVLDNALALRHVAEHQAAGQSFDAAVKAVARADLVSPHIIRRAASDFSSSGALPSPSSEHRGRGNPEHPLNTNNTDEYGPSFEAELLMHDLVHAQKTEGVSVTATTIGAELRAHLDISISHRTVRRWLRALGYHWRHKCYIGGMKPQAKNARIRQFILEYAAALAEEEAGTAHHRVCG